MRAKSAQGLPVNIIVMLILGLVLFGLGMGLFTKVYKSGDNRVEKLSGKVRENIASLECEGDEWICVPTVKIQNGDTKTFEAFIANRGDETDKFTLTLPNLEPDVVEQRDGITNDCGSVVISYLKNHEVNVITGQSSAMPIIVNAAKVAKTPCSFITTATLTKSSDSSFEERTSVIIRVE